jgi:MoaA/NifB/PqqE/SkfB family radical SAM enzyme
MRSWTIPPARGLFRTPPEVWFAQPDALPDPSELGQWIAVLDLGLPVSMAPSPDVPATATDPLAYPRSLGERLVRWIDHHPHRAWSQLADDPRFLLVAPPAGAACTCLVEETLFEDPALRAVDSVVSHGDLDGLLATARFLLGGRPPYPDCVHDAIAADTRQGSPGSIGTWLDRALKARPDDATRALILSWLVQPKRATEAEISALAELYLQGMLPETHRIARRAVRIGPCMVTDARGAPPFDLTECLCRLEEDGHPAAVIHDAGRGASVALAQRAPSHPLPEVLGLSGGSPSRVHLPVELLGDAIERLANNQQGDSIPMPRRGMIEICRRCNLRCPGCPVGTGKARHMPDMERARFEAVLRLFGAGLQAITLFDYGEPLLHPELPRFVALARAAGIEAVDLSTNGLTMSREIAAALIEAGLVTIRISVDTVDPEAYALYRRGGTLAEVLHGIETLVNEKARRRSPTPLIEAQSMPMHHNEEHVGRFEERMLALGVDSVRHKTYNAFSTGEAMPELIPRDPALSRYRDPSPRPARCRSEIGPCHWPWQKLVVLADGTLVPCCYDFDGRYPLGKIEADTRLAPWDTRQRRAFMLRRLITPERIDMCRHCSTAVPALAVRRDPDLGEGDRRPAGRSSTPTRDGG